MLRLYGSARSRAVRVLWMLGELGLKYDHKDWLPRAPETKTPEYRELNPNSRVPTIDDDGFILSESMAINFYLAKKHKSPLFPSDPKHEALVLQPDQRFTHWRPAHAEVRGELLFEDMMAGGVMVVENAPADFRVGLVDARFALAATLLGGPGLERRGRRLGEVLLPRLSRHESVRYQNRRHSRTLLACCRYASIAAR